MSFPVAEGLIGQCEDQRWSNGDEEEKEEDDEEDKDNDEAEEEDEEENDTSSETEAPDDLTEKPTDASPSPKPEELSEEHEPDGEQKAEEKTDVGVKPANGTTHSSTNQSGPSKKLSLFRRLSSTKSKQTSGRDQTPAEGTDSGNAAPQGRPSSSAPSGNNHPETNRGRASQRSRSGACTLL